MSINVYRGGNFKQIGRGLPIVRQTGRGLPIIRQAGRGMMTISPSLGSPNVLFSNNQMGYIIGGVLSVVSVRYDGPQNQSTR